MCSACSRHCRSGTAQKSSTCSNLTRDGCRSFLGISSQYLRHAQVVQKDLSSLGHDVHRSNGDVVLFTEKFGQVCKTVALVE